MGLLKKLSVMSAVTLLALGATGASAADNVAVLGHISATVQGNLAVSETNSINFGNFTFTGGTCAPCAGDGVIVMSDEGTRTAANAGTDKIGLLFGLNSPTPGIANGTNLETGSQRPGFYQITSSDGVTNIYISFSDNNGAIVDSAYDPSTHPNNYVTLTGPGGSCFKVNKFTFETDNGAAANGSSGYTQASAATTDVYGSWVPLVAGAATLRVGGTLTTLAGTTPTPGQYKGTFYLMVAY